MDEIQQECYWYFQLVDVDMVEGNSRELEQNDEMSDWILQPRQQQVV